MDISQIRLINMRQLEKDAGGRAALSEKLGIAYAQVSHYIGKNPVRNIGDKIARQAEEAFVLPFGWMDRRHDDAPVEVAPVVVADTPVEKRNSFDLYKVPLVSRDQIVNWLNWHSTKHPDDDLCPINIVEWLYTDMNISAPAFMYEIEDEAMYPEYKVGHRVLIEPEIEPDPADDVCAYVEGEGVVFRRYKKLNAKGDFELQPLNELYAAYRSTEVGIKIQGVMIEHRMYRKKR